MKVLVLGGTTEASALARLLAGEGRFRAVLSYAGRTRNPAAQPVETRIGGFGGAAGLADYLRGNGVRALIDATHPFAARISAHAAGAARDAGVPLLALRRGGWTAGPGDEWHRVPDMAAAADAIGIARRRVFLTVGQKEVAAFRDRPRHAYLIRSVDPIDAALLPPEAVLINARGPFDVAAERALLDEHGIDVIVTKNSGGTATAAKLAAARDLGLPVIMVERPPVPDVETVETAEAALAWLRHQAILLGV
ncbi:cobalt-precorrin-6A reductase [Zavarzinia compransoris]|uniref:Cobalt-precorrin-6A reductase n=1 Tax=Zavarzinia compransoris TaxID=1264899 RepID=A0A317E0I4_9PROT|nr:cobalt-precorrin-6A reductase [Zavarzinia compransoris]PWR19610.1 cobalt-precorrin-6A reductase [Zavarzinia compransoris]TDP40405.1 precorrin-6A reductase [Zavarzinia compransoris]